MIFGTSPAAPVAGVTSSKATSSASTLRTPTLGRSAFRCARAIRQRESDAVIELGDGLADYLDRRATAALPELKEF